MRDPKTQGDFVLFFFRGKFAERKRCQDCQTINVKVVASNTLGKY